MKKAAILPQRSFPAGGQLAEMSWTQVAAVGRDTPIVIPLGAFEQHGAHLPLATDALLVGEIARRAAESLAGRVLFAPVLWLGNSHHHIDFPGTLSASPRTYLDALNDLADNLIAHGFRRVVFLNGHGGNEVPGKQALFEARQRHRRNRRLLLLLATYWNLADPGARSRLGLKQEHMRHACEWETSMMLRLAPRLVRNHRRVAPADPAAAFEPAFRAWVMPDRSARGHLGFPGEGSPEKGEALFRIFADGVVRLLERVIAWNGRSWRE
ncbi:MAG: creatininase family protein [Opitutaceae bacterium]|nr:creatininase family protein [Opitutaceae bacterium]